MNTDYYKALLKVVETGSISKAAEQLGYTQSGISHIINKLEKQFDIQLLYRNRSGVTVTEKAQQLLPMMESVVQAENVLMQAVKEKAGEKTTPVRIAMIHTAAVFWLPSILKDLKEQNPAFEFEIVEKAKYPEIEKALMEGEADCGFTADTGSPNLTLIPLFRDEYFVVMPEGHPLTSCRSISPEQLKTCPFIIPEDASNNKELAQMFSQLELKQATKQEMTVNTLDDSVTLSMVEQGWGISIVSRMMIELMKRDVEIRRLDKRMYRTVGLVLAKDAQHSQAVRAFVDFVYSWFEKNNQQE